MNLTKQALLIVSIVLLSVGITLGTMKMSAHLEASKQREAVLGQMLKQHSAMWRELGPTIAFKTKLQRDAATKALVEAQQAAQEKAEQETAEKAENGE